MSTWKTLPHVQMPVRPVRRNNVYNAKILTIMKKIFFIFCSLLLILLFNSCKNKNQNISIEEYNKQWQAHIDSVASTFKTKDTLDNNESIPYVEQSSNTNENFLNSIINSENGIYKATITDAQMLIIAVDAVKGANFDIFAQTYLQEATRKNINIKGCLIVDIKNCQFQNGAVTGKRIGKAYK